MSDGPGQFDQERAFAEGVIRAEAEAVAGLAASLGEPFHRAVDLLEKCAEAGGTVLVTGLGKSGLVGAKISATLSSLGIPSHAVHPTEAAHGDLGRFRATDTVLAISYSGETHEVVSLCAIVRQDGLPVIGVTGRARGEGSVGGGSGGSGGRVGGGGGGGSSLERLSTVHLPLNVDGEAGGGEWVAPTCSTTAAMALGDALALATARRRRFTHADFARRHPGGALGGLLRPVTDVMRFRAGEATEAAGRGGNLPLVPDGVTVGEALAAAAGAARRPGAMVLVDPASGRLTGIFTDGDLRRLILRDVSELSRPIREVMTRGPRTLPSTALVRDAVQMFREHRQDEIPIVDGLGRPVGMLDVQDLIAMRLVED